MIRQVSESYKALKHSNISPKAFPHELKPLLLVAPDNPLPQHWEDMKGSILKQVLLTAGSQEYNDVLADVTKNGLFLNIIQVSSSSEHADNDL